jgi:hypothetical protein
MFITMKKINFLLLVFCLVANTVWSQKHSLDNVLNAKARGMGAIMKNNTVSGYFSFCELDKNDKKSKNYQLSILDQNLSLLNSKKFTSEFELLALEAVYNGELIMIKFFDEKADKFILKTYNSSGDEVRSISLDMKKLADSYIDADSKESLFETIFPIENKGFAHLIAKRRGGMMSKTFVEFIYIPNDKSLKEWTWLSDEKSESYDKGLFIGCKDSVILLNVNKSKSKGEIQESIVGLDCSSGKQLYDKPFKGKSYSLSTSELVQIANGNFWVTGYYFNKDENFATGSAIGVFGAEINNNGDIINEKYLNLKTTINKMVHNKDKNKNKNIVFTIFKFLNIDNKFYLISEGYGVNKLQDFYVFELENDFTLKRIETFEKNEKLGVSLLPTANKALRQGIPQNNFRKASPDKTFNSFATTYNYTITNANKTEFTLCYTDIEKAKFKMPGLLETQKEYDSFYRIVNFKNGEFATDKFKFDTKAKWQQIYPAKSGYVMIAEYFKKEKKLDFRMEKVNF